jgi:hypothetical protein
MVIRKPMVPPKKISIPAPRPFFNRQGVVLAEITPVILTYNEASNIGRSLERLTWARQVVIVDSGSTDETMAIAGRFANVRTFQRPFDTHAQQWRFAVEETGIASDWLLRLDADHLVEPALRDELAALVPAPATAAYEIAFIYCIVGRPCVPRSSVPPRPGALRAGWPYREAAHRRTRRADRQPPAAR